MSDEIKAGDIRISRDGNEIKVLAIDGKHFWAKWDNEREPRTHTLFWAYGWTTPKPSFFEENCRYRHEFSNNEYEVLKVVEVRGALFAMLELDKGSHYVFDQGRWDKGHYKKI